jgi:hypothetical protein
VLDSEEEVAAGEDEDSDKLELPITEDDDTIDELDSIELEEA